LLFFR